MSDHSESNSPPAGDRGPLTLSDAGRKGELPGLYALRDWLARQIEDVHNSMAKAPLAKEWRETLSRIGVLEAQLPEEGSIVDELTERRASRFDRPEGEGTSVGGGS